MFHPLAFRCEWFRSICRYQDRTAPTRSTGISNPGLTTWIDETANHGRALRYYCDRLSIAAVDSSISLSAMPRGLILRIILSAGLS